MKSYTNLVDANNEIKRLKQYICCNCCPISERTYYGGVSLDPGQAVQITISINNHVFYDFNYDTPQDAIDALNILFAEFATFSITDSGSVDMVTNFCGIISQYSALPVIR